MTPILGPPSVSLPRCGHNLIHTTAVHARFVDEMMPELWAAGVRHGIDPVVMVAQSVKETGGGHFLGLVPWHYHNTCGLKTRDPGPVEVPVAHAQFASWWAGAEAHAQHLRAYCQLDLPAWAPLLDPRWVWVRNTGTMNRAAVRTVEELGGKWAPSLTYGQEIAVIVARLTAKG